MSKTGHAGGCRCGAVRFRAEGAPLLVANCHCRDCRRATGAAFATFVDYPRNAVRFSAPAARYSTSPGAERLFCALCGSPIAYEGERSAREINIHLGAFDDPQAFEPLEDAHASSALEFVRRRFMAKGQD